MLIIPPVLINNKLTSNFEGKAYYFNDFFASQCTPLNNNSKIPETQYYVTNSKLTSVKFESKDISTIIRPSDVNKTHRIITFPLCCINQSMFPDIGEKSNICLIPEFIPSSYVYHCFCL